MQFLSLVLCVGFFVCPQPMTFFGFFLSCFGPHLTLNLSLLVLFFFEVVFCFWGFLCYKETKKANFLHFYRVWVFCSPNTPFFKCFFLLPALVFIINFLCLFFLFSSLSYFHLLSSLFSLHQSSFLPSFFVSIFLSSFASCFRLFSFVSFFLSKSLPWGKESTHP